MDPADTVLLDTRYGRMWALRTDAFITRCLRVYGEYCEAEATLFGQLVQPGATVVEVGANIGSHTVMLARAAAPGRVIAFEPQQRVFQLLCANLVEAGVGNVIALPEALGAAEGVLRMPDTDYGAPTNFGGVSPTEPEGEAVYGWDDGQTVRVGTLDSMNLAALDLLKVDVEGWECDVLRGARETIMRLRPIIYVENDREHQQGALIALLEELQYDQFWHVAPLFNPNNFHGERLDVTGGVASLNMLCTPRERGLDVSGFEKIDPANWRSPMSPIPPA